MGKKNNNFLGEEATKTIPKASRNRKKLRRSRKPKFDAGEPNRRIDGKKKDKKRKRKRMVETQIAKAAKLREDLAVKSDEIRALNQWLDEFPLMFDEIRAFNQLSKELDSEINASILDHLHN